MHRLLYTMLFCLGVYALSLLALLAVEPIVNGAWALGGSPAIMLAGRLTTQAQPVAVSSPAKQTAQAGAIAPSAPAASPTPAGEPPAFWLLPLPPDLLMTALMLRRLWRGRRTYGAAPAWRLS